MKNSECLTTEEILDFVMENDIDLIQRVNSHIMDCEICLKKVKAFDIVKERLQDQSTQVAYDQMKQYVSEVEEEQNA